MSLIPDFLLEATNVYRTKNFIVRQIISIQHSVSNSSVLFSYDTFFKRTKTRDKQYNFIFKNRINLEGKRLTTTANTKNYID